MSALEPVSVLDASDRAALALGQIPHQRPFVAACTVGNELLSRLVPHVNNVEYLRWVDRIAELHADTLGYTREALLREDRCFFVARHEIEYCAECWANERILVATWVHSMKRTTSWRETVIVRPADQIIVARARTLWAFVDMTSRRPTRIPATMLAAFDPLGPAESVAEQPS